MSIHEYSAWVLAALHRGDVAADKLAAVSDRFRALAERMAATPLEGRTAVFQAALSAMNGDAVELEDLMDAADPTAPTPAGGIEPWGEYRTFRGIVAEPFPPDVLPLAASSLVELASAAIGCPPDFVALPCLAVAAGAIGRSVSLMLASGRFASASLYACVVGYPSTGKTPALDYAARPLYGIDDELGKRYLEDVTAWEADCAETPKGGPKPPKPVGRSAYIDDATCEVVPLALSASPRGLTWIKDEITSLTSGLNQYKGGAGNDMEALLKWWSGKHHKTSRVKLEGASIRCPHPCLTIVGGTTPANLKRFIDPAREGDGFRERVLFAYPDRVDRSEVFGDGVPDDATREWGDLIRRLYSREMNGDAPHVARFTPKADRLWRERFAAHVRAMNSPDTNPDERGMLGKMDEHAARLALVLCLLDRAGDPTADPRIVPQADAFHVESAWRLADYFTNHARRVAGGATPHGSTVAEAVVQWIKAGSVAAFTESDLTQARKWLRGEDDRLAKALAGLVKLNAIRPVEADKATGKPGRPKSTAYEVNPALLTS